MHNPPKHLHSFVQSPFAQSSNGSASFSSSAVATRAEFHSATPKHTPPTRRFVRAAGLPATGVSKAESGLGGVGVEPFVVVKEGMARVAVAVAGGYAEVVCDAVIGRVG